MCLHTSGVCEDKRRCGVRGGRADEQVGMVSSSVRSAALGTPKLTLLGNPISHLFSLCSLAGLHSSAITLMVLMWINDCTQALVRSVHGSVHS